MDRFEALYKRIIDFRNERDWSKFHSPENLSKSIVIEAAELLEHFQWGDDYSKEEVLDELADIMLYGLFLSDSMGVDILDVIENKLNKNEKRFPKNLVKGTSGKHTKVKVHD